MQIPDFSYHHLEYTSRTCGCYWYRDEENIQKLKGIRLKLPLERKGMLKHFRLCKLQLYYLQLCSAYEEICLALKICLSMQSINLSKIYVNLDFPGINKNSELMLWPVLMKINSQLQKKCTRLGWSKVIVFTQAVIKQGFKYFITC